VRVIAAGLAKFLEHLVGPDEEHPASGPAGGMAESGGQEGLTHAHRAKEDGVLSPFEEPEAEEITHPVTIEGDLRVPIELLKGLLFCEAGPL